MSERSIWLRAKAMARAEVVDKLVAFGLMAFSLVVFFTVDASPRADRRPDALGVLLIVAATGALVYRRRRPVEVLVVASAAALAMHLLGYSDSGLPFAVVIALYTVGSQCDRRLVVGATAALLVVGTVSFAMDHVTNQDNGAVAGTLAAFVLAAVWGDRKKVRDAYVEQLKLRDEEKERERVEAAQRAVTEERLRIARELHDVVAHAMSVVAVQSGVGAHVIDTRPAEAKRLLETISETSRDSLGEMRRLLSVLRAGPGLSDDDLVPAPGLDALGALAARIEAAGVPVQVVVEGEQPAVPAGVDLAAYRIAQEALTNVLKHAGQARARLLVAYEPQALHLEVTDDGRGVAALSASGAGQNDGQGLVGMRERAAMYDGRFEAGPRPGGGYRVAATLRFAPAAAASAATHPAPAAAATAATPRAPSTAPAAPLSPA